MAAPVVGELSPGPRGDVGSTSAAAPASSPVSEPGAPGADSGGTPRGRRLADTSAGGFASGLILIVLALLPLFLNTYAVGTVSRILGFALLVISVDLLTGITGLPALGQAAYFGVGAYAAGLTGVHVSSSAPLQLLVAVAAGAAAAAVTGWVAVQTRGTVFLMVTLAVGSLAHQLADSWSLTGGSNGLVGVPPITILPGGEPLLLAGYVYWWILAVFVVTLAVVTVVVRSPFGRTLRGMRDNEARMRALGYTPGVALFGVYCLAGAVAGAAGAAWVAHSRFFSPGDMGFEVAAFALLSVVLGGAGSLWGPCLAAAAVLLVRDELSGYVDNRGALVLGVVFVTAVYLLPRGLAGLAGMAGLAGRPAGAWLGRLTNAGERRKS